MAGGHLWPAGQAPVGRQRSCCRALGQAAAAGRPRWLPQTQPRQLFLCCPGDVGRRPALPCPPQYSVKLGQPSTCRYNHTFVSNDNFYQAEASLLRFLSITELQATTFDLDFFNAVVKHTYTDASYTGEEGAAALPFGLSSKPPEDPAGGWQEEQGAAPPGADACTAAAAACRVGPGGCVAGAAAPRRPLHRDGRRRVHGEGGRAGGRGLAVRREVLLSGGRTSRQQGGGRSPRLTWLDDPAAPAPASAPCAPQMHLKPGEAALRVDSIYLSGLPRQPEEERSLVLGRFNVTADMLGPNVFVGVEEPSAAEAAGAGGGAAPYAAAVHFQAAAALAVVLLVCLRRCRRKRPLSRTH